MDDIKIDIEEGLYVVAVSGGVDSMVLLHLLNNQPQLKLIVAHFDHGIREDSRQDRELVQKVASRYGLPFVFDQTNLGAGASEAVARKARYQFLNKVLKASHADAIITAHHQDDLLETAIFNILRGTNRKGLSSLKSTDTVKRPLLRVSKNQIRGYALTHGLLWREDYTNLDQNYKRNYIRFSILPRLDPQQQLELVSILESAKATNRQLDAEVEELLISYSQANRLNRRAFIMLPHKIALEVMAAYLRKNGIRQFNAKLLSRLVVAAKTLKPGQRIDVNLAYLLQIGQSDLALTSREC